MSFRRRLAVPAALCCVLAVAACTGDDSDPDAGATPSPTSSAPSTDSGDPGEPTGFGPGPDGSGLDRFYDQEVDWQPCGEGETCADIWVPLDYADPDGTAITVKAKKKEAADSSARRGTLFINPGGPGGSGVDYVDFIPLGDSVASAYDVIGFDPRGVATSTPVDCLSDADLDAYVAADPSPDTPAEIREFEHLWQHYTDGCEERSGELLGHVSTVEVARDLDILRSVVGDKALNFFGASYGTYIGATYAGLFPDRVDRMVLDGAVDPEADPLASQLKQTVGFEEALNAYLSSCVSGGDCPLGGTVNQARETVRGLLDDIDAQPLSTASGRELTQGLAFLGMILPLYDRATWDIETQALSAALQGQGDMLLALADAYTGRQADGTYKDNAMEVQSAVNCLDRPQDETVADIQASAGRFERKAPVFGSVGMWFPYACSNWPLEAAESAPDFSATGAPPIVVVGTTRDPATPYQQAVRLAETLDSGVLLSRDGDGHTAYGRGSACVDDAIDTYLVSGKPPADGTMC